MSNFERNGGAFSLDLTLDEAHILINLVEQLLELFGEGDFFHHYDANDPFAQLMSMQHEVVAPDDPVLLRLLPNAYADPEAANDFRRFTEGAIRASKQRVLHEVRAHLAILVDQEQSGTVSDLEADTWLMALNDLRLALSVRLEIDEASFELFESLPDEDPQKSIYAVYYWLGWLQENLLHLL
jgi:hypothetical protein